MVYLHFPSNLTDEELMLQAKYAKLRKKKKALHAFQSPKPEPEKSSLLKRPLEPKDAKEFAKKLILSGKISVVDKTGGPKTIFKRPRGLERKLSETRSNNFISASRSSSLASILSTAAAVDSSKSLLLNSTMAPASIKFQPFTPSKILESNSPDSAASSSASSSLKYRGISRNKGSTGQNALYPNFVPASSKEKSATSTMSSATATATLTTPTSTTITDSEEVESKESDQDSSSQSQSGFSTPQRPKQGNTVHVRAHNISEEICREAFGKIGNIVNVTMELERSCGFITFDKIESAEKAIGEVNGIFVGDMQLHVSFARRQPPVTELINDAPASATWTALASSQSQKGTHQDKRDQVIYDEGIDF